MEKTLISKSSACDRGLIMKIKYDDEYERLNPTPMRLVDSRKYTMLMHIKGIVNNAVVESHWHEWVEILYVIRGKQTVFSGDKSFEVEAGNIVFIGSTTPHKLVIDNGEHYTRCYHIHAGVFVENKCLEAMTGNVFIVRDTETVVGLLDKLADCVEDKSVISQVQHTAYLLLLISKLLQEHGYRGNSENIDFHESLYRMCVYIQVNYAENLTLSSIAEKFEYSPQHVALLFRRYKKVSFLEYVNSIRIHKAKYSLAHTNTRVINIAYECGYSSEHTFIRNFKKIMGVTPQAYRKRKIMNGKD